MIFTLASMLLMTMLMQVLLTGERVIPTCFAIHVICPPTKHLKATYRIKRPPASSTCISIVISHMLARVKTTGSISTAVRTALPLLADSRAAFTMAESRSHGAY